MGGGVLGKNAPASRGRVTCTVVVLVAYCWGNVRPGAEGPTGGAHL